MNRVLAALVAAFGISCGLAALPSSAGPGGPISRPYEWTIEIDTQELQRQFQYRNSGLSQVVKTELKFYAQNNQDAKTSYEDLWYSDGKSLGLERHNKLNIKPGDAIAITVVHSKPDSVGVDEQQAAGKAVMKAIVDATINRNMVATIRVPAASFQNIAAAIQHYNFTPVAATPETETPVNSDINLFMESVPPGQVQYFVHYH